jgi:hypothetical protein
MHYLGTPNTIVEVGPGYLPAYLRPGTKFNDSTDYLGIEPLDTPNRAGEAPPWATFVKADFADLSGVLPDTSVGAVILRSVYGEYTMPPEYTGSSLHNTRMGPYEAFRVLRTGGEIVIAEENTPEPPAHPSQTGEVLISAGFTDIRVMPCQEGTNPEWTRIRTQYWGDLDGDRPIDTKWGYAMVATKPKTQPTELETFEGEILVEGEWTTKNYLRRIPQDEQGITIVARDAVLTMDEYRAERRKRTIRPLFIE